MSHDMRDKHTTFGIVDPCDPRDIRDIRYDFQKKIKIKEKLKKKNLKKGYKKIGKIGRRKKD